MFDVLAYPGYGVNDATFVKTSDMVWEQMLGSRPTFRSRAGASGTAATEQIPPPSRYRLISDAGAASSGAAERDPSGWS